MVKSFFVGNNTCKKAFFVSNCKRSAGSNLEKGFFFQFKFTDWRLYCSIENTFGTLIQCSLDFCLLPFSMIVRTETQCSSFFFVLLSKLILNKSLSNLFKVQTNNTSKERSSLEVQKQAGGVCTVPNNAPSTHIKRLISTKFNNFLQMISFKQPVVQREYRVQSFWEFYKVLLVQIEPSF